MKWRKLGQVYVPVGTKPWARSHAANPIAEYRGGNLFRIYFSTRDEDNRSSVDHIEIDLAQPTVVLAESKEPVIAPGDLAMFDDSGVSIGCILSVGKRRYLYYMGWHLTVRVPWQNALGLAISEGPDAPFKRYSRFPIIPLSEVDPYTISYPWVLHDGRRFRMWYGSNLAWGGRKEDMRHIIKYAESDDGIHWERTHDVALDFAFAGEYAICKPCVLPRAGGYEMWFCSRGETYRIRHAVSEDGRTWRRTPDEEVGIDVSSDGWDAEMIEYPHVFDHHGHRYMLFAGNGFGRTGFGLAVAEEDQ